MREKTYGCPVERALDMIGGKWKTVILARLKEAPMRYGELRLALPSLSDKVLTQRLHELEASGFVRKTTDDHDRAARYGLTELGRSLAPVLSALYAFGEYAGGDRLA